MSTLIQDAQQPVFGFCESAIQAENGTYRTTTPADKWHSLCKGIRITRRTTTTVVDGRKVTDTAKLVERCACHCHEQNARCLHCGVYDTPDDPHPMDGMLRCLDRTACEARHTERLAASPLWRKLQTAKERATEERARKSAARASARPGGRCEHCGAATGGGRFLPGHDAKLKGTLLEAGRNGSVEDLAELLARNWRKKGDTFDPDVERRAYEMCQADPDLVTRRTAARWEAAQ